MSSIQVKIGFILLSLVIFLSPLCNGQILNQNPDWEPCTPIGIEIDHNENAIYAYAFENSNFTSLGNDIFIEAILIKIEHSFNSDISFELTSPSGLKVLLFDHVGGAGDNFGDVSNPEVCSGLTSLISPYHPSYCTATSINSINAPFVGDYVPEGDLSAFHDGSNPNGLWTVEINDEHGTNDGELIYFDIQFTSLQCYRPLIEYIGINNNGDVELVVDHLPNCEEILVEWGEPGFIPGSSNMANEGELILFQDCAQTLVIEDLIGNTNYDFYVRRKCTDNQWSLNSCLESIQTTCSSSNISFFTDFDISDDLSYIPLCSESYTLPGEWMNYNSGDLMDWGILSGAAHIGLDSFDGPGNYLALRDVCIGRDSALLYSPCIDIHALNPEDCHLYFDLYLKRRKRFEDFKLQISTDGGFNYIDIWQADLSEENEVWERIYIDLHTYNNNSAQFRFFAKRGGSAGATAYLDNITFLGSTINGYPTAEYYLDADSDGYGSADYKVPSCALSPLSGFSENAEDCDDNNVNINPAVEESPCNGLDDDCDLNTSDLDLQVPLTTGPHIICSGEVIDLEVEALYDVIWYDGLNETEGPVFQYTGTNPSAIDTLDVQLLVEYADDNCKSSEKGIFDLKVLPAPKINFDADPQGPICFGDTIDLAHLSIVDIHGLAEELNFYSDFNLTNSISLPFELEVKGQESIWVEGVAENNCKDVELVILESQDSIGLSIAGDTLVCPVSMVELAFELNTSNALESILWSSGDISLSIQEDYPQGADSVLYWLKVIDETACSDLDSIWIYEYDFIDSVDLVITDVSDCDQSDGQIQVFPTGGLDNYHFKLTGPGNSEYTATGDIVNFEGLSGGSYELIITDPNDDFCEFIYPEAIVIYGSQIVLDAIEIEPVSCAGFTDGSISLVTDNDYIFQWSNDAGNISSANNLAPGIYTVTISEANCDLVLEDLIIEDPDPIQISVLDIDETVSCYGFEDGSIEILATGGNAPYNFAWSNQSSSALNNNLASGDYIITVTDSKSCQLSDTFSIGSPNPMVLHAELTAPTCHGFNDGQIALNVTGGNNGFQYYLDNNLGQSVLSNLGAGEYIIEVEDSKGCSLDTLIGLEGVDELILETILIEAPSCAGVADGQIALMASGGHDGYQYTWDDGVSLPNRSGLDAGVYNVSIEDAKGCSVEETYTMDYENLVSVDWALNPATCSELSDGVLSLSNPSGQEPHTYLVFHNNLMSDLDALPEGELVLVYTDANGCVDSSLINHVADTAFYTDFNLIDPNCVGALNGQIAIGLDNSGVFPYTIQWLDNGSTALERTGLTDGIYEVEITDSLGCKENSQIVLESISNIVIETVFIDSVSCTGKTDGAIFVTASGGIEPYQFTWNNGDTTKNLLGIGAGAYEINVVDDMGCAAQADFNLDDVEEMLASVSYFMDDTYPCTQKPVDSLKLNITGGRFPYTVKWSDEYEGIIYPAPQQQVYAVEILDSYGCTVVLDDVIVKDAPPMLSMSYDYLNNNAFGCEEGLLLDQIKFELLDGQLPLSYTFYDAGSTTVELSGWVESDVFVSESMPNGVYDIEIIDNNGCTQNIEGISLEHIAPISVEILSIEDLTCANMNDASIEFQITGGIEPYQFKLLHDNMLIELSDTVLDSLSAGNYIIIAEDAFNCSDTIDIQIDEVPYPVLGTVELGGQNICYGDTLVSIIDVTFFNGEDLVDEILFSAGTTNLSAGIYDFNVISDACTYEYSFEVACLASEPLQLDTLLSSVIHPSCLSTPDGSINLHPKGGVPPYNFSWVYDNQSFGNSDSTLELDLEGLLPGIYNIDIRDSYNCPIETSDYLPIILSDEMIFQVDTTDLESACFNEVDAMVAFEIDGGTMPYTIEWNSGALENLYSTYELIEDLYPALYSFSISDEEGCTETVELDLLRGDEIIYEDYTLTDDMLLVYFNPQFTDLNYSWAVNENISGLIPNAVGIQYAEDDNFLLVVTDTINDCSELFEFNTYILSGTEPFLMNDKISVYPNPAKDNLKIDLTELVNRDVDILLFNSEGSLMDRIKPNARLFNYEIPGHLKGGNYMLLFLKEGNLIAKHPLVIMK